MSNTDILGVIYDKAKTYDKHIRTIERKAAAKIACLRRITWVIGAGALEMLYKDIHGEVSDGKP